MTYAGRYDKFNFLDDSTFAPRIALVYKASPKHTFRASYNKSNASVSALQQYVDFPLLRASGTYGENNGVQAWLSGQENDQVITTSLPIEVVNTNGLGPNGGPIEVPQTTPGIPLAIPYGAVLAGSLENVPLVFGPGGPAEQLAPFQDAFVAFFTGNAPQLGLGTPYAGPAGFTGTLYPYALTDGLSGFPAPFDSSLWGQTKAQIVDVNSFEIGYSGIIG